MRGAAPVVLFYNRSQALCEFYWPEPPHHRSGLGGHLLEPPFGSHVLCWNLRLVGSRPDQVRHRLDPHCTWLRTMDFLCQPMQKQRIPMAANRNSTITHVDGGPKNIKCFNYAPKPAQQQNRAGRKWKRVHRQSEPDIPMSLGFLGNFRKSGRPRN